MSYYNKYKNKRKFTNYNNYNSNNGNLSGNGNHQDAENSINSVPNAIFDLGKNKRVTVRQFRSMNLIDIREYYLDNTTGEMKPGKKGISLTEDLYDELLNNRLNIDDALRRMGSKRHRSKLVTLDSDDDMDNSIGNNNMTRETKNDNTISKGIKNDSNSNNNTSDSKNKNNNNDGSPTKKKAKVAPPALLLHEQSEANAKREAVAQLVIPSVQSQSKQDTTTEKETKSNEPTEDNSSDEEFAESLQAEMDKMLDESSEEE